MAFAFHAEPDPAQERCAEVAAYAPTNPFYTPAYVESGRAMGFQPWILALRQDGQLVSACTAFMKSNALGRALVIHSLPTLPDGEVFWHELRGVCYTTRVSSLTVNSAASAHAHIPVLPGETHRRTRYEYVLELQQPGLWERLSVNHQRNIKRGCKAGLQVRRAVDEQACHEHARLTSASMERRKNRGETVPADIQVRAFMAHTRTGAGELFQVVLGDKVLSSILILLAERGAYYQSAGTSPEGMACSASPFLVYETALILQSRSMEVFNLGGADQPDSGLARFKAGFAATMVQLEATEYFFGTALQKRFVTIARRTWHMLPYILQQVQGRLRNRALCHTFAADG